MNLSYLKPNFSNHWLNYFFPLLIFLGSFSVASMVLAFENDGSYSAGGFYYLQGHLVDDTGAPTRSLACERGGQTPVRPSYRGSWYCSEYASPKILFNSCSGAYASKPYCNEVEVIPNNCPEVGVVQYASRVTNGYYNEDGSFHKYTPSEKPETIIYVGQRQRFSYDGCDYEEAIIGQSNYVKPAFLCHPDTSCTWSRNLVSVHKPTAIDSDIPAHGLINEKNPDDLVDGSPDARVNREDVVVTPTVESVDADGSSVKTDKTITTTTRGDGAVITDTVDTVVVTNSDGIKKVVTETVNVVTLPDGSKTVTTDRNVAYTQDPVTNVVIDKVDGVITVTASPASSANSNTTKTETFDSDGNKTGSSETSSGSGDGEAKEEKEGDDCKDDPDSCAEFEKTEGGEFESSTQALIDAKDEYTTVFNDVADEIDDLFTLNLSGGSVAPAHEVTVKGVTRDIGLTKWFPHLDAFDFGALILFLCAVLSLFIVLGGVND